MVRAILRGKKTQTRRIVRPQPAISMPILGADDATTISPDGRKLATGPSFFPRCPYGQTGDQLWVREKWRIGSWDDGCGFWLDYCDGPRKVRLESDVDTAYRYIRQIADDLRCKRIMPTNGTLYEWAPGESPLRWRPGIHMPRWASRIALEITGVRVERLQSITEDDAIAEGIERLDDFFGCASWKAYGEPKSEEVACPDDPIGSYTSLWESIHGPGSWTANPWVWVIEFKQSNGQPLA